MSLVTIWSPHFQSPVRMRGRSYYLAGRVRRQKPQGTEMVQAEVRGREAYAVTITQEGHYAVAQCNCLHFERGSFCKHIWALLLDIQNHAGSPDISESELAKLRVRSPKARKRDPQSQTPRAHEPEWIGRLALLRPTNDEQPPTNAMLTAQRQVCYVLLPQASGRQGGLVIALRQRHAIARGWSQTKPLKLSAITLNSLADPTDRQLCALILGAAPSDDADRSGGFRYEKSCEVLSLPSGARCMMLRRMIDTGRCYIDNGDAISSPQETPVLWDGDEPWVPWLVATEVEDQLVVNVQLRRGTQSMPVEQPELILGGNDGLLIAGGQAAPFEDRNAFQWVHQFREDFQSDLEGAKPIHVPMADAARFVERLYMLPQLPEIEFPPKLGRRERHINPIPHLDLFGPGSSDAAKLSPGAKNQLVGQVWLAYENRRINPAQPGHFVPINPDSDSDDMSLVRRNQHCEQAAVAQLAALGFRQVSGGNTLLLAAKQAPNTIATLLGKGWIVRADRRVVHSAGPPRLNVKSSTDWFELHGGLIYHTENGQQEEITLPQILSAVRSGHHLIELGDGSQGLLPEQWLLKHGLLTALGEVEQDHLRFKYPQAVMLDAMLDEKQLTSVDDAFRAIRTRLHEFTGIRSLDASGQFQGALRGYQRDGIGWLDFLCEFRFGGILADDMGLGKTIQILAMLQRRKHGGNDAADVGSHETGALGQPAEPCPKVRPSLVVVPRSVVFNWIDEATRFTPDLRVVAYTGVDREILRQSFDKYDMVVTSYGLMRRDINELCRHRFDYVVLDEAQMIKNPGSLSAKAARLLDANHRLALTGTPIENHLGDLWSIFEFLNPGMLGTIGRFNDLLRTPPGGARTASEMGNTEAPAVKNQETLKQVATALRPFILRRTKHEVLRDLPPKTEQTLLCEMEAEQRQVYEELRRYYQKTLMDRIDRNGGSALGRSTLVVLEALLRLRQAACHPGLIDPNRKHNRSAKLDLLLNRLQDIVDEGSKALVFSQFTSMLDLVKPQLEQHDIPYCYLDGQTQDRKRVVEQFQTDEQVPVFLISLKAGGLGLNLTAAEYVFILDPWWNPAVEAQAIDRTHRIGQTKPVFAYRMICQDTVEQRITELQAQKKQLADAIVGGNQTPLRDLTRADLQQLLS